MVFPYFPYVCPYVKGVNITITSPDGKVLSGNELFKKAERKMQRILNARRYFERFLQDLSNSWKVILIGLFIAMVLALVWIVAIRLMAGLMVWLGILGILSFLIIGEISRKRFEP